MTTVEILIEHLERHGGGASTVVAGRDRLRVVAGRPGSVCFTLEREATPGLSIVLAEGFSLDGQLVFDRHTLPPVETERIIRRLIAAPNVTTIEISGAEESAAADL